MKNIGIWIRINLFNFLMVSILGVVMRYNLAFSLPGMVQIYWQESHSHFAFYGWVTSSIYLFVTEWLRQENPAIATKRYQVLMLCNQIGSYGMLFSFIHHGYYWLSIVFSAVALFCNFAYFVMLLKDTKSIPDTAVKWLRAGAFFAIWSSIGIAGLACFSSRKNELQVLYRASTYFYLHYQYNGFFIFSCIGILLFTLKQHGIYLAEKQNRIIFSSLLISTFLGYGLSILWIEGLSHWILIFLAVAALQLYSVGKIWWAVKIHWSLITKQFSKAQCVILKIAGLALLLKSICQFFSAIPVVGAFAFNNINIIIAYLHLVLLMGISLFIMWRILGYQPEKSTRINSISLNTLVFGIVLNECILAFAGLFPGFIVPISTVTAGLLLASVIIMMAIGFFLVSFRTFKKPNGN